MSSNLQEFAKAETAQMHDSLHQFLITPIVKLHIMGIDISFTNAAFFMILLTLFIMAFQFFGTSSKLLVPNRFQSLVEVSYEFITGMIRETAGREGLVYFPLIFSLFMFVLMANTLGMIPYAYTVTSQIIVTFALAIMIFIFVTIIGFYKHGMKYFRMFLPEGTPMAVAPLLIPIEIISYCMRPVTLSVRLFANMLAGHVILKVIAGFTVVMGIWGLAPISLNVAIIGFEFFVAGIQAYIFTILSCLYLHDALHLH